MTGNKRVDPRRPYFVTADGRRRIVLGEAASVHSARSHDASVSAMRAKPQRTASPAVRWHMAIVHSSRGRLDDHAREAIAAAAILADAHTGVLAVVLGSCHEDASELGADEWIVAEDLDATRYQPLREKTFVQALTAQYAPVHVFMPDNSAGDGDLGRRLIAAYDGAGVACVSEIDARHVAVAWSGGSVLATAPLPRFMLLQPGAAESNLPFVGAGRHLPPPPIPTIDEPCRDLGLVPAEADGIALEEADFIVSAGNGVSNVATLEELAHTLGAAIGASRAAVDEGKFPRSKQIGASGKSVAATTYLAIGISGAVQHLQGIKACRHVIAINRDPAAPIVKRADLAVIGDAEEVMRALIARVAQVREQSEMAEGLG